MGPTLIYRTFFARAIAWSGLVVCAFALVFFVWLGGPRELVRSGGVAVAFAVLAWALFEFPCVTVSDGGITVRNITRTIHVPWTAYLGAETVWQLRIRTTEGDVDSWAIPAPTRAVAGIPTTPAPIEPGTDVRSIWRGVNANVLEVVIRERHEALTAQGWLKPGQAVTGVERTPNSMMILVCAAACTFAVLGFFFG